MPKRPTFNPLPTPYGWLVSIPESMSGTGKRKKRYFEHEKDAKKFAGTLRTQYHDGLRGGTVTPELARMASDAAKLLEPLGITLLDAAKAIVRQHQEQESSETLKERWLAYTGTMEQHWSQRHIDDMAKIPRWVGSAFMERRIAGMSDHSIRMALKENGAASESTIKARLTRVKAVLSGKGKKRRAHKIALLDRKQLALMKWRSRKDPQVRMAVGLLLFAGVRPGAGDGEISRLDWAAVGEKEIYVDHEVAKTSTDRHIPITRRLRWWIRGHPKEGTVIPAAWPFKWQKLRRACEVGSQQDLTRHTFASNYLAVWGENDTKLAMGHTRDSDTLFRHYRRSVTKDAARRYFGLATQREPH